MTGRFGWILLPFALSNAACGSSDEGPSGGGSGYKATIRETSYGIPHIVADDLPSAVAGLGYVGARDYGCILLDQIVRVRSERAKYFGAGTNDKNLDSDFGMLELGIRDGGKRGLAQQSKDLRAAIAGYVAGFNYYLAHEKLSAECEGKEWAKPLAVEDLFAYYYWLAQLASGDPLFGALGAKPPGAAPTTQSAHTVPLTPPRTEMASNGWAIGKDRSTSGRGLLLANPHFPWEGNRRFYESQITVPGVVDVYGASLVGAPVINIGFNEHVAWTHTVTTARHFTLYKLTLVPGDPTSYLYDGKPRAMTATDYTVAVRGSDGTLTDVHSTLYRSHYGPILDIPQLGGWTTTTAISFRNANEDNFSIGEQWLRMNQAKSLDDLKKINEDVQGIPWVNTMAVDADGNALYMDASRTPNLSDAALSAYENALKTDLITQAVNAQGATILDGSDSTFEWQDAGAKAPGIVPFSESPILERTDFVFNSNDSYWLTNPNTPLTGFSPLFGDERTPRTPRTRMNAMFLTETTADGVSGSDGKFSFDELSKVEFNDRTSLSELLLSQVVARCDGAGPVTVDGASVDISPACGALKAWDGRFHLDSAGAVLFREFLGDFAAATTDKGKLFDDAFDPDNPVATPRVLVAPPASGDDPVLVALGRAVKLLESAGFDVTTPLGDAQHTKKNGDVIPIHGSTNLEGAFNIVDYNSDSGTLLPSLTASPAVKDPAGAADATGLATDGYLVNNGSSFMMVLEFQDGGPHAQALLSYSESDDPASPHFADQTELFSESKYRPVLFSESDVLADPNLKVTKLDVE